MRRQWHTPLWVVVDILASCATAAAHRALLPIFHLFPSPRLSRADLFPSHSNDATTPLVSPSSFPFISSSSVASGSSRGLVCGELRGLEARA